MSYAALLALLAALAFTLPFLARLAENIGIPRSYGIIVTLALGIVLATYAWLRWHLRNEDDYESAPAEPGVLPEKPYVPEFFFHDGVFQGEPLLVRGHRDAALKMYEAYRALLARQGQDTAELDKVIKELGRLEEDHRESVQRTG